MYVITNFLSVRIMETNTVDSLSFHFVVFLYKSCYLLHMVYIYMYLKELNEVYEILFFYLFLVHPYVIFVYKITIYYNSFILILFRFFFFIIA